MSRKNCCVCVNSARFGIQKKCIVELDDMGDEIKKPVESTTHWYTLISCSFWVFVTFERRVIRLTSSVVIFVSPERFFQIIQNLHHKKQFFLWRIQPLPVYDIHFRFYFIQKTPNSILTTSTISLFSISL